MYALSTVYAETVMHSVTAIHSAWSESASSQNACLFKHTNLLHGLMTATERMYSLLDPIHTVCLVVKGNALLTVPISLKRKIKFFFSDDKPLRLK